MATPTPARADHDQPVKEQPIKENDVVTLHIVGAPQMTVVSVNPQAGECRCCWFNKDGDIKEQIFKTTALKRVSG